MSVIYIQLSDQEFKGIIKQAMLEGAKLAKEELQRSPDEEDSISQEEALAMIGCGTSKLANLRTERKVKFYTTTRPYRYSKKSVQAYLESTAI
ncbi:hypothetical protein PGH07_07975 [Sulfurovum sp. zt1-1]|uniref:Helix-turn-helix domain-containing protein n=1 Tax=Sulfurovum zhangzhouensis TaxID=3019067 RepID=A0ABT7QZ36_9BACT|nr:hypothetical protein [Sulfurovum zhangzhouensis]MDM5272115.1 hypothetical protein [Sulfurovum zhangzhouensis]